MYIAICVRFNWEINDDPFRDSQTLPFLKAIQERMPHITVLGLDWRTIHSDGTGTVFDLTSGIRRISLADLLAVHVLNLGYGTSRHLTLRGKWREVREKLSVLDALGVRCINPLKTIVYGIEKTYLTDLAAVGLPVIETLRLSSSVSIDTLKEIGGACYQIVKPANGECGKLVLALERITCQDMEAFRRESDELLLQPFVPEILAGEKSLVFFGPHLYHAVRKIPSGSDFRANGDHTGARICSYEPSSAEVSLGERVRAAFLCPIDTFRLDLVGESGNSMIMEVEVVDPGHYCPIDENYVNALAGIYTRILADRGEAVYHPG